MELPTAIAEMSHAHLAALAEANSLACSLKYTLSKKVKNAPATKTAESTKRGSKVRASITRL